MQRILLYCLLLASLTCPLFSQENVVRYINEKDGLENVACYDILQDQKEYLWIATNNGMYKYNGRNFKAFKENNGMLGTVITNLFEDKKGRIFYSTLSSKIGYIFNDSCNTVPASDSLNKILENGKLYILQIGSYDSLNLIISTQRGHFLLDKATLSNLKRIDPKPGINFWFLIKNSISYSSFYLIHPLSKIYNFHITGEGYDIYHQVDFTQNPNGGSSVKSYYLSNGKIAISLGNEFYVFSKKGLDFNKTYNSKIINIREDKSKNCWVFPQSGNTEIFVNCDFNRKPNEQLPDHFISDLIIDKEGNTWLSSLVYGLLLIGKSKFLNFPEVAGLDKELYAMRKMDEDIYFSTIIKQLYVHNNKKDTLDYMRMVNLQPLINVRDIIKHHDKIYVGASPASYVYDSNWNCLGEILIDGRNSLINRFAVTSNDEIWGIKGDNIFKINGKKNIKSYSIPARSQGISVINGNEVFITTGYKLYELKKDSFYSVSPDNVNIFAIKQAPDGSVWVCTDRLGVLQYKNRRLIRSFSSDDGLKSNCCYNVEFDKNNDLWIATDKGLSKIETNGSVINYTMQDGLPSNLVYKMLVDDDLLYLSTNYGLCMAKISDLKKSDHSPPIYIIKILCNDEVVDFTQPGHFSHYKNNIQINLDAIAFLNGSKLQYKYRLQGVQNNWKISNNSEITFNNLPPGNYKFEVVAITADGIESKTPAVYEFVIRKAVYQTWWFILLVAGGVSLAIYLAVRRQIQSIRKKEQEKTRINQLLAESQLTALQAQMNPHFIFNAMNSIQAYILNNEKQAAYDYLAKFSNLIRKVLQQSQHKTISLAREIETLSLYIELEQNRFKNKFTYEITTDPQILVNEIMIPTNLIQPLVENAIWHGLMHLPAEQSGKLTIHFSQRPNQLVIIVTDNGIGREAAKNFKKEKNHESMGTQLVYNRLSILASTQYIQGKIITLDLYNQEQQPTGTEVQIILYEKQ
jgi:two-component sensor histidine kinase